MFPIPFNFPFRKKNGDMTTIGDAISSGSTPYTLPTASAETKGGVKIGSGLTMTGDVLSVSGGGNKLYLHNFTFEFNSTNKIACPLILNVSSAITSKDDLWDIVNNNGSPVKIYGVNYGSEKVYAVSAELNGSTKGWRQHYVGGSTYSATAFSLADEVLPLT